MKKLKRLFSLIMVLIILVAICTSNISISATDVWWFTEGGFSYYVSNGKAFIDYMAAESKVLNIPDIVTHNDVTYPVVGVDFFDDLDGKGSSGYAKDVEILNAGKNTEEIWFNIDSQYRSALKIINIPTKSKLNWIDLNNYCPNLESINFPSDSVLERIYIGTCPKLKKLSLPKTLKYCKVGTDAPNLKVKIAKGNKYLKVKGNQILSKNGKKLIDIVGNKSKVTVYKTVKVISDDPFNKYIKKLTFGKNVTKFKRFSFYSYKNLKIILKNKNKAPKIDDGAFDYAKNIKFYVQNKKVAKDLKKKLKGSGIKKAKILVGKKVVYKNING